MSNIEHKDVGVSSLKGTPSKKIYIKTSTEAVHNPEGVTQEYINNHVDGSKIVDGTVTSLKLADNSVSTRTIQGGAVTEPKLADAAVSTRTILNGAVTNQKIANGAVNMSKLNNEVQTLIQQGASTSLSPMGEFDIEALYWANDMVYDPVTNSSYLSLRADNMGHAVDDEEWWMKVLDGSYVNLLEEELQQLVDSISDETQQQVEELNEALEALEAQADQSRQDIQDIVDSLAVVQTTGQSASDVMSQKAVTDSLVGTAIAYDNSQSGLASDNVQGALNEVANNATYWDYYDITSASFITPIINGSGSWTTVSNTSSILIPVSAGDSFKVIGNGNANGTIYAFLTSEDTHSGTAKFAGGATSRTQVLGEVPFYISSPSDAAWLWIMHKNAEGSMMPYLYKRENIGDIVGNTSIYDNIKVDLSILTEQRRNISPQGQWNMGSKSMYSVLLPVAEDDTYIIDTSEQTNPCIYALLEDSDWDKVAGDNVSFTPNTTRTVLNPNKKVGVTIPSGCNYICFTSMSTDRSQSYLPILYKVGSSNIIDTIKDVNDLKVSNGLDINELIEYNRVINGSGNWYFGGTDVWNSKLIPVNAGDVATLCGSIDNKHISYYALLTDGDIDVSSGTPASFCNGYDGRYELLPFDKKNVEIPSDCQYLYVLAGANNINYGIGVYINNSALIKYVEDLNNRESQYTLIYHDDFDKGINKDMWGSVEFKADKYGSHFFADNKNWYADGGCMVLKLDKRGNSYYGPYITTAKTLAVNAGKAEVRIRCNMTDTNLGWCFWLFGQNEVNPKALEIDLYEKSPADNTQGVNIHYLGLNGQNVRKQPTKVNASVFEEWHTIGIEWDENGCRSFMDGVQTSDVSFSDSLYPLIYPQQFCFNIKCGTQYNSGDAYVFVDYIKIWALKDGTPITGFEQSDLTLSVEDEAYINPTYIPSNCTNKAFSLISSDESIVHVQEFEGNYDNSYMVRRITGVSAGTATLTITAANGSTTKTFTVTVE